MKKIFLFIFLSLFILPLSTLAQEEHQEEIFKAKIIEVLEEKEIEDESGLIITQQNLKLEVLSGSLVEQHRVVLICKVYYWLVF